ncbi:DoxX family membrane protein [Chlamydiota bacterium]
MAAKSGDSGGSDVEKRRWIAVLRIYLGFYFLVSSLDKFKSIYFDTVFIGRLRSAAANTTVEWYRDFLINFIAPHSKFFAFLNAACQFMVGLALILGFIAGLFCIIGILIKTLHLLGSLTLTPLIVNNNILFIVCFFVLIFHCSGRTWGLDRHLSKKILFKYLL